jgi:Ca-activated chloride channel homolog
MNKRTLLCLGVFLMLCLVGQMSSAGRARLSDPAGEQRQAESVALLVNVTDAAGRLVTGLESQHFEVFENETRQPITSFSNEDTPVSIGVALAVAGDQPEKLDRVRATLKQLAGVSNPDNEIFTADNTTFHEAVTIAARNVSRGRHPKRALLIIADGQEQTTVAASEAVRALLKQTGVPVYAGGFSESANGESFPAEQRALLTELAQTTGGKAFFPTSASELRDELTRIALELRHQYRIGYTPVNAAPGGQGQRVKVRLTPPRGLPALSVRVSRVGS